MAGKREKAPDLVTKFTYFACFDNLTLSLLHGKLYKSKGIHK
jgi:hypothetical protein